MKNPKKTLFILSVLCIGTVLTLICTACASPTSSTKDYTVKYEITGPAAVAFSLSYKNSTGGTDTLNNVNIPWSKTVTVSGKNISLILVAGFDVSNENTYTTKIYVNGKQVASSSGTYAVSVSHTIY